MDGIKTHILSYRFYFSSFKDNKNNFYPSGFLAPRIAHIKKGSANVQTEKGIFHLKEGTTWFIPRFSPYSSQWFANPEVCFYTIELEMNSFSEKYRDMQTLNDIIIEDEFIKVQKATAENDEYAALAAIYSILATITPHLKETKQETARSVLWAVDYITENYKTNFKVADLAKNCYLSESRFYLLFKKTTGFSPIDYKNYLKINQAVNALLNNTTLEDVCEEFNFCSPAYFRRLLKKFTKKSPSEIKKDYGKL